MHHDIIDVIEKGVIFCQIQLITFKQQISWLKINVFRHKKLCYKSNLIFSRYATNNFITFRRAWLMPHMVKHKSWDDHFFQKMKKTWKKNYWSNRELFNDYDDEWKIKFYLIHNSYHWIIKKKRKVKDKKQKTKELFDFASFIWDFTNNWSNLQKFILKINFKAFRSSQFCMKLFNCCLFIFCYVLGNS
jgi:hypothetical protein